MLCIVPHIAPLVGRSNEHFSGGFELQLLSVLLDIATLHIRHSAHSEASFTALSTPLGLSFINVMIYTTRLDILHSVHHWALQTAIPANLASSV